MSVFMPCNFSVNPSVYFSVFLPSARLFMDSSGLCLNSMSLPCLFSLLPQYMTSHLPWKNPFRPTKLSEPLLFGQAFHSHAPILISAGFSGSNMEILFQRTACPIGLLLGSFILSVAIDMAEWSLAPQVGSFSLSPSTNVY